MTKKKRALKFALKRSESFKACWDKCEDAFFSANERSKERERKRKGKEEEGKEKGKGEREREIGSEALAETEKFANSPAGKLSSSVIDV